MNIYWKNLDMKKIVVLFILVLSSIVVNGQNLIAEKLTSHDGLSSNTILSFAQSNTGRLFIGTVSGLNRYDGNIVEQIKEFNALNITALLSASDSTIYVGTLDSIATVKDLYSPKVHFYSKKDGLEGRIVYSFYETGKNQILISTENGIFVFSKNKIYRDSLYSKLNSIKVFKITHDLQGTKYFATSAGLFVLNSSGVWSKPINGKVLTVFRDKNNRVWARSKKGIYKKRNRKFVLVNQKLAAADRYCNFQNSPDGKLLISQNRKLFELKGTRAKALVDTINNPINSIINTIFIDKDKYVWLGTNTDGILRIKTWAFSYFERHSGIKTNPFTIMQTKSGEIYIGTDGQGVLKFSKKKNRFIETPFTSKVGKTIWVIFEDSDQNLWFSSDKGVYQLSKNKKLKKFAEKEGLAKDAFPINFFEDDAQNIWVTTLGKVIYKYNGKNFKKIKLFDNDRSLTLYKILPDINYGYWLIAGEGLFKFDGEKIVNYKFQKSLDGYHFYDAVFSPNGNLILATFNHGLLIVDFKQPTPEKGIQIIDVSKGLPNNSVVSLLIDKRKNLWAATFGGLAILKGFENSEDLNIIKFAQNDNILGTEYNQFSLLQANDNTIWLGGINKIIRYNPHFMLRSKHFNKPYIKDLSINYKKISPSKYGASGNPCISLPDNITLPYYLNNISFSFSSINFSNPKLIEYSIKLEPINSTFSGFSKNNKVHFVGLPSGSYTLFVRSKDQYGTVSSTVAKYRFTIATPFYKTASFILIVIILFALMIWGIIWYRNKDLKKKNKELKEIIDDKKRAEGLLKTSEKDYRELFATAYSPIIIISQDDLSIVDANDSASKLLGYSTNELREMNATDFTESNYVDIKKRLATLVTSGGDYKIEKISLITKGGKKLETEFNIKSQIYRSEKCYLISIRDLTKENEINRNLQRSQKLKDDFLAQISHEIGTPLNSILANVEYLTSSFSEVFDETISAMINSVHRSSKRIQRTIDLILKKSELEQNDFHPHFEKIDVCDCLLKNKDELEILANGKNLDLAINCSEEHHYIHGDFISVDTILLTIMDNAIKYTNEGRVDISVWEDDKRVIVEVKDTGIGIKEEYLPHLFDAFSQEDIEGVYTRKFDGNGLGLHISKIYAKINHAKIEVESKKGVGSTFRVVLRKFTGEENG
jgi:PAS domain S-box-containing protein